MFQKHFPPLLCALLGLAALLHAQQPDMLKFSVATPPGALPKAGDHFGYSVAVSGNIMVVGMSRRNSTSAADVGSAFVYDLAGATPAVPILTLRHPAPAAHQGFGSQVAISGTRIAVSANVGILYQQIQSESVYVFDLGSATPTVPVANIGSPGSKQFGSTLAMSGALLVVGASQDETGGSNVGSAYVFDLASATPTVPLATLRTPVPAPFGVSGCPVGISGTRIVVGAPGYTETDAIQSQGRAYVYDLASATPSTPTLTLENPAVALSSQFGSSVAVSGTRVVIGRAHGGAYVYDVTSNTPASPVLTLNTVLTSDVAISGTRVVVAVHTDAGLPPMPEGVFVYDLTAPTPTVPVARFIPGQNGTAGHTVALDGTTAVAGAPNFDTPGMADVGAAYVYGPSTGTMTVTPGGRVDTGRPLTVTFNGWPSLTGPPSYTVLIDGVEVSPSGSTTSRHLAAPITAGVHTIKGRISDSLGNFTEVTRVLTVNTAQESWRVFYFGTHENAGLAADSADPDGDGGSNLFEWVSGRSPTNAASKFQVRVEGVAGEPGQRAIIFGPVMSDRTYAVKCKASLAEATWTPLASFSTTQNGSERTVIDLGAGAGSKFYIVEIVRP